MANTHILIASQTLTSSATGFSFTSIPQNYTDLLVKINARSDYTLSAFGDRGYLTFNSDTFGNYSVSEAYGTGTTGASQRTTSQGNSAFSYAAVDTAGNTANMFTSSEIYIPNYTVSASKPFISFSATEDNTTTGYNMIDAGLWRNNSAITNIRIYAINGQWVSGSSFYLYGIKNS